MSYEQQERSRVVVQKPTSHREVVETDVTRRPDRSGISGSTVGVIVVLAVALVTILVLLLLNGQSSEPTTTDLAAQQQQQPAPVPQTTIVQQPAPPPVIIQQPAPAQAPIIIQQPAGGTTRGPNDSAIEAEILKRMTDDPALASLAVTATVIDGKVTLDGSVKNDGQKALVERTVRRIKGVSAVDNQIMVVPD